MFQPTHKIVTEANKGRFNGVLHIFGHGTKVQRIQANANFVLVVSADGTKQTVRHTDLEAI